MRPLFGGRHYIGIDYREGRGVDRVADIRDTGLPNDCAGTILVLETLEHVRDPISAMREMHRILNKKEGLIIITSAMNFMIHGHPHDYWRFTPECFTTLLEPFEHCIVSHVGRQDNPHTVVGMGINGGNPTGMQKLINGASEWQDKWNRMPPKRNWKKQIRRFIPPILLPDHINARPL